MVNPIFEASMGDERLKEESGCELGLVEQFYAGRLAAAQRTGAFGQGGARKLRVGARAGGDRHHGQLRLTGPARTYDRRRTRPEDSPTFKVAY